ncbi:CAP domain-containing protein [Sporosarcina trichiuri]|uniref:CAP domain-containing protein n=1 Tax=Sporosarcina trichiuri TaxID=3056445 RepID=UPI0025B50D09|nr:CAP domain-containing protein [Sporosarcina sp. 0.2-SM1T-5]WJY28241.1 CAP domain-containing protein [Sporosarcina sp. 0.2-SM1T-5]
MKKPIAVILLGSALVLPYTSHAEAASLDSVQTKTAAQVINLEAGQQPCYSKAFRSNGRINIDSIKLYKLFFEQYRNQAGQEQTPVAPAPDSKPDEPSAKPEPAPTPVKPETKPQQPVKPEAKPEQPVKPEQKPEQKPDTAPSVPTPPQEKPSQPEASTQVSASQIEQAVLDLTNAERQKAGLKPLQFDEKLLKSARQKSADMAANRYFSHTSPTYGSPFDQMKANGITYRSAAENIAMGQRSAQEVVQDWMNSPGHRQNILTPGFTHIGIGYDANGNYWTQQFIQK